MFFFHQQNFEPQILHNQKVFYEPHLHDDVEIIIVYQGNFQLLVDQTRYAICSGDAIIIFPNTIHGYSSGENIDVGKFIFDTENADVEDLKINGENAKLINKNKNWFFSQTLFP